MPYTESIQSKRKHTANDISDICNESTFAGYIIDVYTVKVTKGEMKIVF